MTDIQPSQFAEPIVVTKAKRGRKPGFQGSVNREIKYVCDECGADVGRENIVSKRSLFITLVAPVKALRTRTVKWLCRPCAEKDPDWNREALIDSPGMRDVRHD